MTNARPQQTTGKTLRQPRGVNAASAEGVDVCELLLAELHARRERLQKLLHLVWVEAERLPSRRAPVQSHARCGSGRIKRTA